MSRALGEFEQLILFAILDLDDGAYGAAIGRAIEERTGKSVSAGAVYTALDRLEVRGYVHSAEGAPTPERGGRRRKHYQLEPAGLLALDRSMNVIHAMSRGLMDKLRMQVRGIEG